ncbi:MAG TPA: hypothetical protein VN638_06975 [Nitrospiraceae bacterium]|jgi:hypothetical protein|nr:hypothetical protein [Nitrospiraceae bacterium]
MWTKTAPRTATVILAFLFVGCAMLSGSQEQYYVCSYDTVWEGSIEIMKGHSIATSNKEKGLIETNWQEVPPTSERTYGVFGREGFGNTERARFTVTVKRMDDVASVSVLETRERWHARGGVTQQALKWWAIEPSEEVTNGVVDRLNARLKTKGCAPA